MCAIRFVGFLGQTGDSWKRQSQLLPSLPRLSTDQLTPSFVMAVMRAFMVAALAAFALQGAAAQSCPSISAGEVVRLLSPHALLHLRACGMRNALRAAQRVRGRRHDSPPLNAICSPAPASARTPARCAPPASMTCSRWWRARCAAAPLDQSPRICQRLPCSRASLPGRRLSPVRFQPGQLRGRRRLCVRGRQGERGCAARVRRWRCSAAHPAAHQLRGHQANR